MSQSSLLDFTSTAKVERCDPLDDAHCQYLYDHFSNEGHLEHQVQEHLLQEKAETEEIKRRYEEFVESFPHPSKSQKFLRVGNYVKS